MDLWYIQEKAFIPTPRTMHSQETVYSIGNGYQCTRGTFEEGYPKETPATLLFGVFDKVPIAKEELANAPDWLPIKLFVNGERFRLDEGRILNYQRTLDMQTGVVSRTVYWESPEGTRITVTSERFANLADDHSAAIRYSVKADESTSSEGLDLALWASFNTAVGNYNLMHWDTADQGHDENILWLHSLTKATGVHLAQTMSFTPYTPGFRQQMIDSDISPNIRLYGTLAPGETLTTEKIVVTYSSRDDVEPVSAALSHHKEIMGAVHIIPEPDIRRALSIEIVAPSSDANVTTHSVYDDLLRSNTAAWKEFWEIADVIIEGDDKAQLGIRYNLYQLRINESSHDSRYSIAAKGLTGFGYRGHIFHDTEIFMLPFFTFTEPDLARNLVLYRYHTLPAAREKAKRNGYEGAQYAWESTLSGEETTPGSIIHPETGEVIPVLNGSLELHISASVAHATYDYWHTTGDDAFMRDYGAEIILNTAAFWASRAEKNTERNDYEITNVIGPDEWHEHVNNNVFTNYMARWNIQMGLNILSWLRKTAPEKVEALGQDLNLDKEHLEHWQDVAEHMRILEDPQTHLFEQFEGFFKLEPLNQDEFKGRTDSYQGILGVIGIQKYRIIKQADVLMLLTVLKEQFDLETKRVNWDYYYPITDHDYGSSLTPAFHVILACELGYANSAYELFMKGALVDLENLRGNTPEGIHTACSGAVWQAAIFGFAGLTQTEEGYRTDPHLPDKWTRLAFHCVYKGKPIYFDLRK